MGLEKFCQNLMLTKDNERLYLENNVDIPEFQYNQKLDSYYLD